VKGQPKSFGRGGGGWGCGGDTVVARSTLSCIGRDGMGKTNGGGGEATMRNKH